jgi:non-heme chloroperoxidase
MLRRFRIGVAVLTGLIVTAFAAAIGFGGPAAPPPLAYVRNAIVARDRSDLPPMRHFAARDETALAYRVYPAANSVGAAVLIQPSAGTSAEMHEVAKALQAAGIDAFAPDIRDHGASGPRGDIAYIGQLEDDLSDFLGELDRTGVPARRVLIGYSAGGGFALRVAARPLGARFAGTILLAPFLGLDSPTTKPSVGDWGGVGMPRLVALFILDRLGIHAFGGLPVVAFAVAPDAAPYVTPTYSFRLAANFGPDLDWRGDIAAIREPLVVLIGDADQLLAADRYKDALAAAPTARIEILPGIDHMSLSGDPSALAAIARDATTLLSGRTQR